MAEHKHGKPGTSAGKVARAGKTGRYGTIGPTGKAGGKSVVVKTLGASALTMAPTMKLPRSMTPTVKRVDDYNRGVRNANRAIATHATLKQTGGSLMVTLPAAIRKALSLVAGTEMAVTIEGSKVIMQPVETVAAVRFRKPKYTLDELLADANPDAQMTDEERAWHDAPPVGREIW